MTRVFLTGFMGSGKTSCGRLLARLLGWPFLDLDAEIERTAGRSVPEIFGEEGEEGFRLREKDHLARAGALPGVISLGGGTLLDPGTRESLRERGPVVYLRARPATLVRRLGGEAKGRPLLSGPGTLAEKVARILARRESSYLEADWVVDTDGLTPRQVAGEIARLLREAETGTRGGG